MKRFLSLILVAATLALSFVSGFEGLTLKSDAAVNFQCGVNATWDLDENGVLTISGTGDMYDFTNTMFGKSDYSNAPWNDFYRSIKKIVIEEGITNISEGAFINCKNVTDLHIASSVEVIEGRNFDGQNPERITVGENSRLRTSSITFSSTKWFKSQPDDQPVYLGRMLLTYKYSTTPSSVEDYPTVNVKDGTISISERAFNNKPLKNITLPDSIVYVGSDAFAGTYWLQNQPAGPIYAGNTYIGYSGTIPFSENDFRLKEGTTCIAANAFSSTDRISSVYIPSSVTSICRSAFRLCYNLETVSFAPDSQLKLIDDYSFEFCDKLKSIDLPESIEYIGEEAFYDSMSLQKLHITKSLKRLGDNIGNIQKISIDPDNSNFFLDQNAFLYTRDKKELILSASDTNISEYTLQDNCVIIHPYAFSSLKADSIVLNQALKYIDAHAFTTSYVKNVTIPYNTVVHSDSFFGNKTVTIHCYENSSAHKTAVIKGNPYVLLDGTVSDTKLKEAISKAEAIDRTLYTDDSLSKLDAAVSAVNLDAENLTQETIDSWYEAIVKAFDELEYRYFYKPTFYVPEVIYMNNKGTVGQYYYGVNTNGAVTQNTPLSTAASGALVYWNLPGATSIRITCELSSNAFAGNTNSGYAVPSSTSTTTSGITAMTIGDVTRADTAIASTGWMGTSSYSANMTALTISSAIAANTYRFLKWTATYICNNQTYTQHAYTILFNNHQSYNVWCECTNKNSVHSDAYSKIRLNINGVTMGENASGSDSDSSSYTVIGSAQLIYDSTRFSNSSYYPNFTAWYEEASWLEKGSGYVGNFSPMIIGTSATQIEAVLGGSFYIQTTCYSEYKDSQADSTALFSVQTKGINKSNLRSNYWSWIKNQRSEGYDTTQYDTYQLTLLQAAAALAVPGSTDTSATHPDDSGFNPDNNNIEDSNLKDAINRAEEIDRTLYTEDSLAALDAAVSAVNLDADGLTQETIDSWYEAIEKALGELSYKDADYTRINTLKESADKLDRSLYTTNSLSELDDAFFAVEYNLTIERQSDINQWALAIEDALQNLEYLPADYSAVEEALETAQKIDRRYYSQISLIRLDNAVNAVDYSLNILEQERVNSFAKAITDALNALEYASVVLRHEECGVIVSATTKEIKPETLLAVEEVDPSNYEGTNFAVGGSIRSLHFYDINLLYNAVIVQPDGTVTVKIRLKDGVDPNKCKVYHVTEDIVNPLVRFANTIDGNYIVFETDHFSEFAVIEVETVVDRIEISSLPIKTEYGIGEVLDLSGMKVTAYYSNGTDKVIDDYNVGLVTLDSIGTKIITVYYTFGSITKTAEFSITVTVEKSTVDILENDSSVSFVHKKLGIFSLYTKASIQLSINLNIPEGYSVRWSSDNKKVLVDENGKVTCKGLIGAKKANITVEILDTDGKVISSDTVSVIFYKLSLQLSMLVSKAVDIYKKSIVQY